MDYFPKGFVCLDYPGIIEKISIFFSISLQRLLSLDRPLDRPLDGPLYWPPLVLIHLSLNLSFSISYPNSINNWQQIFLVLILKLSRIICRHLFLPYLIYLRVSLICRLFPNRTFTYIIILISFTWTILRISPSLQHIKIHFRASQWPFEI